MEMQTILNSIISLFLILLAGIYGSKKGIITTKVSKGLTDILLEIALPCMIVSSFAFSYDNTIKSNVLRTVYYSVAAYIIIIAVSYILTFPIKKERRTILHFANVFTNTGYIGFPILNAVYGAEAVIYGSIFNMFFVLFLWTYGILLFKGSIEKGELGREILKALLNPSVIAVYIGVLMMIFNFKLPSAITTSINSIGNMTGPISMIIVGAMCPNIQVKEHLRDWTLYYGIASKLILIPALLICMSLLINDSPIVLNSVIILASMPPAAMTSIFAESYNIKKDYATIVVVAATLISIVTLPLLLKIIIK
jgi:malate permease and related proteins